MIEAKTITELFENHPERWTQRVNARTQRWGETCRPTDPRACRWCIFGALIKVYGMQTDKFWGARQALEEVLQKYGLWDSAVTGYNDAQGRTFTEILDWVKEAKV